MLDDSAVNSVNQDPNWDYDYVRRDWNFGSITCKWKFALIFYIVQNKKLLQFSIIR